MMTRNLQLVLMILLLGVNYQCDRTKQSRASENREYNPMVVAFTSGWISTESNIQLRFDQDFMDSIVPGSTL